MKVLIGRIIKYTLWLCLFALLSSFLFGLLWFKGNFGQYVSYLDSIDISQLFSNGSLSKINMVSSGDTAGGSAPKDTIADELEGEFLPEPGTLDGSDFGFSGDVENTVLSGKSQTGSTEHSGSVTAQALVDLVVSKEE